jgi:glucose-6-phosphate-specific signal transduction histidine kinase
MTKQLYRIIQSALNSIEKHAKASMVDVQFFYHKAELVLAIEDNGVGFNFNKDAPGLTMKEMINRVEIMNGKIEISSSKRHGTSIMINVPISGD